MGIVSRDCLRVRRDERVPRAVERNIMDWVARVGYADGGDVAHAARADAVMALHPHDHGNSRNIAKYKDEERTESKKSVG